MGKKDVKNNPSIKGFLNMGGTYRDSRLMLVKARKYTSKDSELYLLEKYYYLLVNTDYLRDETYAHLVDKKSYDEINKEFDISKSYIRNVIYRDVKRLFDDLIEDPFAVVRYDMGLSEEEKNRTVERLIQRIQVIIENQKIKRSDSLIDNMVVDLKKYGNEYKEGTEIDEKMYNDVIKRFQYLSRPYLEMLFNMLDKNVIGYIVYLLTTSDYRLSKHDLDRKNELCDMWFISKD